MDVQVLDSYEVLSRQAADIILEKIGNNRTMLFCAATGGSPERTYELMQDAHASAPSLFSDINVIKLDEWGGIDMDDPGTCESYLQSRLIKPMNVDASRYMSFKSDTTRPDAECSRIQEELRKRGPIDLCLLGLGMNGHIAFNEPADFLYPDVHVANLSESSMTHAMTNSMRKTPKFGLTLGMSDILLSRMILILISGAKKKGITKAFLSKKLSTHLPASLLWLHPNVICLIDRDAYEING